MDKNSSTLLMQEPNLASWKCKKIVEQVREFEAKLDNDHEVGMRFVSLGSSCIMAVTAISYQNPDLLYFYGMLDGRDAQIIQHVSQINFLLTSVPRSNTSPPARPIGFVIPESDKDY